MKSEGKAFSVLIGCEYFETSAKTRVNIEESFHYVVREQLKAIKNPKYFTQKQKTNEGIRLLIGRGWFEMLSTIYRVENKNIEMPLINKNLKNVWILIFSFVCCDENEKMNARLVCKYWNELISNHFRLDENNLKGKRKRTQMKSIVSDHFKIVASDWYMPIIYDNVSHVVVFVDATDIDKSIANISNYYSSTKNVFDITLDYLKEFKFDCKVVVHNIEKIDQENEKKIKELFSKYETVFVPNLFSKNNVSEVLSKANIPNPLSNKKSSSLKSISKSDNSFDLFSFCDSPKKSMEEKVFQILSKMDENQMMEINKQLDKKFQKSTQEIKPPLDCFVIKIEKNGDQKWSCKLKLNNYNNFKVNCQVYCSQQIDVDKSKFSIKKEFSIELNLSYFGDLIEGSFIVLKFSKLFKKTAFILKLQF